ncbi:MAG TPA: cytochrome c3 family protein [Candidatus Sulfotelmatobacter sp.]|nr:cytochrome c3 family protein [Candidatus Sulfotelmatobacter sp.]
MFAQRLVAGLCFAVLLVSAAVAKQKSAPLASAPPPLSKAEACSSCHADISNSYRKTVMAKASGPAADGLTAGEFSDKVSGVHYRVYQQDGKVWMSYERDAKDNGIKGQKELEYFIGSGVKGRTYLFSEDGFWFAAPINWYSQEKRWNMTPAYTESLEIPLNLPAYVDCLNCHASGVHGPVPGTDSKYAGRPFQHSGISCERCHGSGAQHAGGKGPIVNPVKLSPERRDDVCMECHFEGTVAVQQPGKHAYQFQPGERLSDYVHYFVLTDTQMQAPRALSQFEALALSACKRSSGNKMWCGSCHDPHSEPSPEQKVAYYRGKCLACHGEEFAAKHHPDKPDCTHCHMPQLPSKDVAHTQSTDHRILRYPSGSPVPQLQIRGKPLQAFPKSQESLTTTRDYALAWESLAQHGVTGAADEAQKYLEKAVLETPNDPVLLAAQGFVEQAHKHNDDAQELYDRALKLNPLANDAAVDLGILKARSGDLRGAVQLWQGAFDRVPNRSVIGMDLAMAFCAAGQREVAKKYVDRVLEFNPDYGKAKSLLDHLGDPAGECKP